MNIELAPPSKNQMTYDEAILYCVFCRHDGHIDWRIPTHKEYRNFSKITGWFINRSTIINWHVVPVRDI